MNAAAPADSALAGAGAIDVILTTAGGNLECQASAPSAFDVRGSGKALDGNVLRVLARKPVRIELRESGGTLLSSHTVDPAASVSTTLSW